MSGDSPEAQALREQVQSSRSAELDAQNRIYQIEEAVQGLRSFPHRPEGLADALEKSIKANHLDSEGLTVHEVMKHLTALAAEGKETGIPEFTEERIAEFEAYEAEEAEYQAEMDSWEALNQAVGGDLYDDPDKLAIMRRVDSEGNHDDFSEFHDKVVEAINGQATPPTENLAL